jgi:hypothetical protein
LGGGQPPVKVEVFEPLEVLLIGRPRPVPESGKKLVGRSVVMDLNIVIDVVRSGINAEKSR